MRRARLDLGILCLLLVGIAVIYAWPRLPRPASPAPEATVATPWEAAKTSTPRPASQVTPREPLLDQQQVEFEQAAESAILRKLGQAVVESRRTYSYSFTNLGVDSRPASTGARLTHNLTQLALPVGASVPAYRISAIHLYVRESLTPEQQKQVRNLVLTTLRSEFASGARLDLTFGRPSHESHRSRF